MHLGKIGRIYPFAVSPAMITCPPTSAELEYPSTSQVVDFFPLFFPKNLTKSHLFLQKTKICCEYIKKIVKLVYSF